MENNQPINNLQRFVVAQEGGCRWSDASYGFSEASNYYGIVNRDEATAYIEHPILGPRLIEISQAYLDTGKET